MLKYALNAPRLIAAGSGSSASLEATRPVASGFQGCRSPVQYTESPCSVDAGHCEIHAAAIARPDSRCFAILKFLVFVFNGFFWSLGLVTLGLGLGLHFDSGFRAVVSDQVPGAGIVGGLLAAAGTVAVFTGFLGCCGAVKESRCLLVAFFVTKSAVFAALAGAGIWAAASRERLAHLFNVELHKRVATYYADPRSREAMDNIQRLFQCCGVKDGEVDYRRYSLRVPDTCGGGDIATGCYRKIASLLASKLETIMAAGVSVALVVLLGMALSMALCRSLGQRQHRRTPGLASSNRQ